MIRSIIIQIGVFKFPEIVFADNNSVNTISSMKYLHIGNVVWADALEDDDAEQGYWHDMGISLQAQSNPQLDSWCTAVSNL